MNCITEDCLRDAKPAGASGFGSDVLHPSDNPPQASGKSMLTLSITQAQFDVSDSRHEGSGCN